MNINSEYSILNFDGANSLNLMTPPPSSIPDPKNSGVNILNSSYVQYNDFINGISTIYSNQNISGQIPIFWTIPSGDEYVPSLDSSLTGLIPGESYYFIARATSSLPLSIASVGATGSNTNTNDCVTVSKCCGDLMIGINGDQTKASGQYSFGCKGIDPHKITLTGVNNYYHNMSIMVTGLVPHKTYNYSINAKTASFAYSISPTSGSILPIDDCHAIYSMFKFVPNSTYCQDSTNLYCLLNFSIGTSGCDPLHEDILVLCQNCLPPCPSLPSISFANKPLLVIPSGCCSSDTPINVNITNTNPGTIYSYLFENNTSNNPIINPISGIVSYGSTSGGSINTLINPSGTSPFILKCTVKDTTLNKNVIDFLPIECNFTCGNPLQNHTVPSAPVFSLGSTGSTFTATQFINGIVRIGAGLNNTVNIQFVGSLGVIEKSFVSSGGSAQPIYISSQDTVVLGNGALHIYATQTDSNNYTSNQASLSTNISGVSTP
jgi:hypothetical protein